MVSFNVFEKMWNELKFKHGEKGVGDRRIVDLMGDIETDNVDCWDYWWDFDEDRDGNAIVVLESNNTSRPILKYWNFPSLDGVTPQIEEAIKIIADLKSVKLKVDDIKDDVSEVEGHLFRHEGGE